jgi:pseudouridine synthase
VYPVGRLDRNTTGLIVVTNDGDFNQQLAHPKYEVKKIYNVSLDKAIAPYHFSILLKGLNLYDGFMKVDGIYYSSEKHKRGVSVIIHSGRNHIVKRLFQEIGFKVMKLDRPYYGGLTKKHLPIGTYRKLKDSEIDFLRSDSRAENKKEAEQYAELAAKAPKRAPFSKPSNKRRKPAAAAPDKRKSLSAAYGRRNESAPQRRSKVAQSFMQKRKRTHKRSKA